MIRLLVTSYLWLSVLISPVIAQEIVADLSQSKVAITASFSGSHILVFGAVKPSPGTLVDEMVYPLIDPLNVIVTVSGPLESTLVRKKDRVAGIWVNSESLMVDQAPTLYKIATSAPLDDILSETEDLRHKISIDNAIRSVGDAGQVENAAEFIDALIRIRKEEDLYEVQERVVRVVDQTLFRADIDLPANLVEGEYTTRIYLVRKDKVVAEFSRVLPVNKVGLERWVFRLAQDHALLYGFLSLAIAIAAGWGASALFRYVRGS